MTGPGAVNRRRHQPWAVGPPRAKRHSAVERNFITRHWTLVAFSCLWFGLPGMALADWFKTDEQTALERYRGGDYEAAAKSFADPYRRGVALYRAGQYQQAERAFAQAGNGEYRESARYNQGNACFQLGDFAGAAEAYEETLAKDPGNDDAAHNLALTRAMLARLEQEAFRAREKEGKDAESPEQETQQKRQQERSTPKQEAKRSVQTTEQQSPSQPGQGSDQQQSDQQQASEQTGADQQTSSGQAKASKQQSGQRQDHQESSGGGQSKTSAAGEADTKGQGRGQGAAQETAEGDSAEQDQAAGGMHSGQLSDGKGRDKDGRGADQGARQKAGQDISPQAQTTDAGGKTGERTENRQGDVEARADAEFGGPAADDHDALREAGSQQGQGTDSSRSDAAERTTEYADRDREPGKRGSQGENAGERTSRDAAATGQRASGGDAPGEASDVGERPASDQGARADRDAAETGPDGAGDELTAGNTDPRQRSGDPHASGAQASGDRRRTAITPPDRPDDAKARAVERFDQLGRQPGQERDAQSTSGQVSSPEAAVEMGGAGMELMERRLEQIQGDPTLLIRNQYRVDELRQTPGVVGPWQEPRPW